jgi:hypothetical protein
VSYSHGPHRRNFTLAQEKRDLVFRLRTPLSGTNGTNPELQTDNQPLGLGIQHIVATYRDNLEVLYLNGIEQKRVFLRANETVIDAVDRILGQSFNWVVRSAAVFPLGILVYLSCARTAILGTIKWASFAVSTAGVTVIESLRLCLLDSQIAPFNFLVVTTTALISTRLARHF